MSQRLYSEDHEWIEIQDDFVTIGITTHASEELGEIVYVDLPEVGAVITKGDEFGSVESVKTVSGLFAPIDGEVIQVNQVVIESPETINSSPLIDGWLIKISVDEPDLIDGLMNEDEYQLFLSELE